MEHATFDQQTPPQQTGFAPRRQYDNAAAQPVLTTGEGLANGQLPTGTVPAPQAQPKVQVLQRPQKVKKEKITDLTSATSKLAIEEETLKMVRYSFGNYVLV